jgi:glycogen operon protein
MIPIHRGDSTLPGATVTDSGTNFSLRAPHGDRVELCLFVEGHESRVDLPSTGPGAFAGITTAAGPGTYYGYRVHGRWDPEAGIFTNPAKLLLDPYARQIAGEVHPDPALMTHRARHEDEFDRRDSAPFVPRSVVVGPGMAGATDTRPATPWQDTLIYEAHVRGLTMRHPAVPPELRGTFAGVATPPVIEHLLALGVTAIELLPVQHSVTEPWLARHELSNYWGYSTVGWFAPQSRYSAGPDPLGEFKEMVQALHAAGIEVILDVVYNHSAEGNHLGPTLCYRGLDNPGFYRLDPANPRRYLDWTGTGNTVDLTQPWALELCLDSLRYWAAEMNVDGFRFDLAVSLGRVGENFTAKSPFFESVAADPVLSNLKLIAEPWDLGPHGYQLGRFPPGWREWNGKFRDDVRDFWRGEGRGITTRVMGSQDVFGHRGATASINFVTSHDGFTLEDLVSYDHKHNAANHEHNRDGESHNRSWNSGIEGPNTDPLIVARRRARAESLLGTLLLSRGVPMLLGGDEIGRSQGGNNNAYSQDNEVSWLDWEAIDWDRVSLTQTLSGLRRTHRVLRLADAPPDVLQLETEDELTVALYFDGSKCDPPDSSFLLACNGRPEPRQITLPAELADRAWKVVVDTTRNIEGVAGSLEIGAFGLVVARADV